jgi:hypothetical protein
MLSMMLWWQWTFSMAPRLHQRPAQALIRQTFQLYSRVHSQARQWCLQVRRLVDSLQLHPQSHQLDSRSLTVTAYRAQEALGNASILGLHMVRAPEMRQAHYAHLGFKQLHAVCEKHGMRAQLHIFEGGETVVISKLTAALVRMTRQDGDDETASAAAAHWLIERKYLTPEDLEN